MIFDIYLSFCFELKVKKNLKPICVWYSLKSVVEFRNYYSLFLWNIKDVNMQKRNFFFEIYPGVFISISLIRTF